MATSSSCMPSLLQLRTTATNDQQGGTSEVFNSETGKAQSCQLRNNLSICNRYEGQRPVLLNHNSRNVRGAAYPAHYWVSSWSFGGAKPLMSLRFATPRDASEGVITMRGSVRLTKHEFQVNQGH